MSTKKPAICGQAVSGQSRCGDFGGLYGISAADYGENPKVNLATGRVIYEEPLVTVGQATYAISISAVYNSRRQVKTDLCVSGWSLSMEQKLIKGSGKYFHVDSVGDISEFRLFDDAGGRYYNSIDAGQTLTVSEDGSACISDDDGNQVNFDPSGKPVSVVSGYNAHIKKIFQYDSLERLSKIYDERLNSGGSVKSFISFEYAENLLSGITVYDDYTKRRNRKEFEYDEGFRLVGIRQTAYNSNGIKTMTRTIKSFLYQEDMLVAIIDEETRSAAKLNYDASGRISNIISGVIDPCDKIVAGAGISSGGEIAYSGIFSAGSTREVMGSGVFSGKKSCSYEYYTQDGNGYGARLTNEFGVSTSIFLDKKYRIVSQFEAALTSYLTLKQENGKVLNVSGGYYSDMRINDKMAVKIAGSVYSFSLSNFNLSYYTDNKNKYYECSFWLRHFEDEDRLKIKFEYKLFGDTAYKSQYIWVNGRAKNAWQRTSATIALNKNNEGKYDSSSVTNIRITLCRANETAVSGYELSYLVFNPAPKLSSKITGIYEKNAIENFCNITITAKNNTYTIADNNTATNIYFTVDDILRSLMNKYKKLSRGEDDTYFDVICNDGSKRLPNVTGFRYVYQAAQYNFLMAEDPVVAEMITADGKLQILQKFKFLEREFKLETEYVYCDDGLDGSGSDKDRRTSASKSYNYHGQQVLDIDEYGVRKEFTYNDYGQLIRERVIGSDGISGETIESEYDENGGAVKRTLNSYDYQTYHYNSPFSMITDVTEGQYNEAAGAYEQSGEKQVYEYNSYHDRITRSLRYDSGVLAGKNEITYENGRVRTVSNGYVKYGQKHDFVNDKVEYTRFNGSTEEVVQTDTIVRSYSDGTSTSRSDFANGSARLSSEVDKYSRLTKITENGAERVTYTYQTGNGSGAAQKISSIEDDYEGMTTEYHYDAYNNLYGWKKGNNHLEVQQISAGDTKYTFTSGNDTEKYFCSVSYDSDKIQSPRISSTTILRDSNDDADDDLEALVALNKKYTYDTLGRLTKKTTYYDAGSSVVLLTITGSEEVAYKELNGINIKLPASCSLGVGYSQHVTTAPGGGITSNFSVRYEEAYEYDKRGRIIRIEGVLNQNSTSSDVGSAGPLSETVQTKTYAYDNLNRLISESDSMFGTRTYEYGANGKPRKEVKNGAVRLYEYNARDQLTEYAGIVYTYDSMGNRKTKVKNAVTTTYGYTRGNLLSSINGNITYGYNCDGVRFRKTINNVTTTYYLDGAKILGEDRKDGNGNITRLRYFYDIDGLSGIIYNGTVYQCKRNAYGDVMMIAMDGTVVARYAYDAWGNCKVFDQAGNENTDANFIGNLNPFRWKGHYFDAESGLYYANGSYYDPEVGQHLDAASVSSVMETASEVFALDINGLMCDNILAYLPYVCSIFTTVELSPDPTYDPDANKPWWELAWKSVVEWFNNLSYEIKIFCGVAALIMAVMIVAATTVLSGGTGLAVLSAVMNVMVSFAVGVVSTVVITTALVVLSGGDVAEAFTNAVADAVFWGGIFEFVGAGINAVKAGVRSAYNAKLAGSSQTGAQPQSVTNLSGNLKDYELDPRSIELAKQGNPSLGTFRKRVWQYEAKFRPEKYPGQLDRMAKGLAPKVDGDSMQLHHVVGKANDMYNVVKFTKSQHVLFHKTYGYHYNSNWNMQSIINLFG